MKTLIFNTNDKYPPLVLKTKETEFFSKSIKKGLK